VIANIIRVESEIFCRKCLVIVISTIIKAKLQISHKGPRYFKDFLKKKEGRNAPP
jgi:hypothetical protein